MEWIDVKKELPKAVLGKYIVCLKNNAVIEMHYSSVIKRWWSIGFGDESENNKVTHWMPLPEPPTKH